MHTNAHKNTLSYSVRALSVALPLSLLKARSELRRIQDPSGALVMVPAEDARARARFLSFSLSLSLSLALLLFLYLFLSLAH